MFLGSEPDLELDRRVARFLYAESRLLDERRYEDWLNLLANSFFYSLPLPQVREDPFLPRYHDKGVFFEATKAGLELKLGRMHERTAWSDRPHSFTRRFVSNVMAEQVDDAEIVVRSNIVLMATPANEGPTITTAGREDRLTTADDGSLKLTRRTVFLDVEVPRDVQLSVIF